MTDKGLQRDTQLKNLSGHPASLDTIVLDKSIFSNVFEKDIRRVYIYKKSERLAKAVQLILPAFKDAHSVKRRLEHVAMGLIDAGVLHPKEAREQLSRELLTLASVLSVARAGGMLSPMNADIISKEAHNLLRELADYEDQRVVFEDAPSLATLAKASDQSTAPRAKTPSSKAPGQKSIGHNKRQSASRSNGQRSENIISILKTKGSASIKDISMLMREVSEKTIQRELAKLVDQGRVSKSGERRWTTYTLIGDMS